jgi:hypothetical protein
LTCAPIANAATGPSPSTATPASAATNARSARPARKRWAAAAPTAAANCFSGLVGPWPAHPPFDLAPLRWLANPRGGHAIRPAPWAGRRCRPVSAPSGHLAGLACHLRWRYERHRDFPAGGERRTSPAAGQASVGRYHPRQVSRMLSGVLRRFPAPWPRAPARMRDRGYLGGDCAGARQPLAASA